MAAEKPIELTLVLNQKGVVQAVKNVKSLNKELDKNTAAQNRVSNAANKVKRNQDGVAQRTGNATKDFARQSQGLGGLVAAYATVAANVFALSSAFLVLRNSADLSSMIKSAEDLSNQYGLSVTRITRDLQKATGGALSFAQALPTINKAISAGIGVEDMEKLAVAATKASQTFGGTANEALNRFISASQRGRVEIIQTLGIVINTEQAYRDYAATIGKTADQLLQFEKQQAIVAATIEESQNIFEKVNIDPNPFQQLLTTITDLKDEFSIFITDALTPMFNAFNQSKAAALALIAAVVGSVAKRVFPAVGDQIQDLQKRSIASTKRAKDAVIRAKNLETASILKNEREVSKLSKKALRERTLLFNKFYKDRLKNHKSFGKTLITQQGKINAGVLNQQRAAITRELNLRAQGREGSKAFRGISVKALENQRNALILLTKQTDNLRASTAKLTAAEQTKNDTLLRGAAAIRRGVTTAKAQLTVVRSELTTGFSKSFASMQVSASLAFRAMAADATRALKIMETQGATSAASIAASFRVLGRVGGIVAGGFTKLLSTLSTITVAIGIATFVWEKFGDTLKGITPEMTKFREGLQDFEGSIEETSKRTAKVMVNLSDEIIDSLKDVQDAMNFTSGTFQSFDNNIKNLRANLINSIGVREFQDAIDDVLSGRGAEAAALNRALKAQELERRVSGQEVNVSQLFNEVVTEAEKVAIEAGRKAEQPLIGFATAAFANFDDIIATSIRAGTAAGISESNLTNILSEELAKINTEDIGNKAVVESFERIKNAPNNFKLIAQEAENLAKILEEDTSEGVLNFANNLILAVQNYAKLARAGTAAQSQIAKGLRELDSQFTTFLLSVDRTRSAAAPNKELLNFATDTKNNLETLRTSIKDSGVEARDLIENLFGEKGLQQIGNLFGEDITQDKLLNDTEFLNNLIADIVKQEKIYLDELNKVGEITDRIKALEIERSTNKAKLVTSDQVALDILKEDERLQQSITQQTLDKLKVERASQAGALRTFALSEKVSLEGLAAKQRELDITNEQIRATAALLEQQKQSLEVAKLDFELKKKNLDSLVSTNSELQKSLAIVRRLSDSPRETLELRKLSLENTRRELRLRREIANARLNALPSIEASTDEQARQRQQLQAQLLLIKAQNQELDRQQLILDARDLDTQGTTFTREGAEVFGRIFRQSLRDGARDLESTMETLGRGFADTVTNTLSSSVTLLLEGRFSEFGRNFVETLKAGLREAIGEAITNRIKEALVGVFGGEQGPEATANVLRESLIEQIKSQTTAIEANTEALMRANAPLDGPTSTSNTLTGQTGFNFLSDKVSKSFEDILKIKVPSEPISVSNTPNSLTGQAGAEVLSDKLGTSVQEGLSPVIVSTSKTIAEEVKANTEETKIGFGGLLQLIPTLLSQLTGIGGGGEGNIFGSIIGVLGGIIGFADGGMMKGRKSVPAFADGGLVSKPMLAQIGEGSNTEAVVPLPNNREIPVQMINGGGDEIKIEQNFDFRNADANSITKLRAEARNIEERTFQRVFTEINKGGKYAKIVGRR